MDRSDLLKQAEALINGDRASDYGSAGANFCRIKQGWNIIIQAALTTHGEINEGHVAPVSYTHLTLPTIYSV